MWSTVNVSDDYFYDDINCEVVALPIVKSSPILQIQHREEVEFYALYIFC